VASANAARGTIRQSKDYLLHFQALNVRLPCHRDLLSTDRNDHLDRTELQMQQKPCLEQDEGIFDHSVRLLLSDQVPIEKTFELEIPVLCHLALFRRPRSSPAIRTVIARYPGRKSRVAISGIQRLLVADSRELNRKVDKIIVALTQGSYVQQFEGEWLRLDSGVHEYIYKHLTEPYNRHRIRHLAKQIINADVCDPSLVVSAANAVLNLLMLAYWHRRIARYYYSSALLSSKDLNAFWEYVYHRVSAIRYLTLSSQFIGLLEQTKLNDSSFAEALLASISMRLEPVCGPVESKDDWEAKQTGRDLIKLLSELAIELPHQPTGDSFSIPTFYSLLSMAGLLPSISLARVRYPVGDNNGESTAQKLLSLLHQLTSVSRAIHIEAMRHAFDRTREQLLAKLPSETIIGWTNEIIAQDVERFQCEECFSPLEQQVSNACSKLVADLRGLQGVVAYQRRAFRECLDYNWEFLHAILGQMNAVGVGNPSQLASSAHLFYAQFCEAVGVSTWSGNGNVCSHVWEIFTEIEKSIDPIRLASEIWDLCKASLLTTTTSEAAEVAAIKTIDWIASFRRSADCLAELGNDKASAFCLHLARELWERAWHRLRSQQTSTAPTSKALEHLEAQYLSNLRRQIAIKLVFIPIWKALEFPVNDYFMNSNGEVSLWKFPENIRECINEARSLSSNLEESVRESLGALNDFFEYRFEALAVRGRTWALSGGYIEAHRAFDRASAGLESTLVRQRIPLAKVHLYRAEALVLSARRNLAKPASKHGNESEHEERHHQSTTIDHCWQLLERASEELVCAENLLTGARKDITAWIYVEIGKAQVCLEQIVLGMSIAIDRYLVDSWNFRSELIKSEKLTDKAIASLRRALDSIPFSESMDFDDVLRQPQYYPELKVVSLWMQIMVVTDLSRILIWWLKELEGVQTCPNLRHFTVTTWRKTARTHRFEEFAEQVESENWASQREAWEELRSGFWKLLSEKSELLSGKSKLSLEKSEVIAETFKSQIRDFVLCQMLSFACKNIYPLWRCRHPGSNNKTQKEKSSEQQADD
jgi:hypothetical protein